MRLIAVCVVALLSCSKAWAFDCMNISLPSSFVICSDPELMRLADARQEALNEARGRIDEGGDGIAAWQNARGLAVTGLFGDVDARVIEREAVASPLLDRGQSSLPISAGEEIPLKNDGGVYEVGVRINRAITLDFIVDSGASDVLIPADVAMTLARAGTISGRDFIGNQGYRIGDGSTLKSQRFVLRELNIGGQVVQNVVASIGSVKGEPLLGQSFLARFGSWSVNNDRHVLVLGELRR